MIIYEWTPWSWTSEMNSRFLAFNHHVRVLHYNCVQCPNAHSYGVDQSLMFSICSMLMDENDPVPNSWTSVALANIPVIKGRFISAQYIYNWTWVMIWYCVQTYSLLERQGKYRPLPEVLSFIKQKFDFHDRFCYIFICFYFREPSGIIFNRRMLTTDRQDDARHSPRSPAHPGHVRRSRWGAVLCRHEREGETGWKGRQR